MAGRKYIFKERRLSVLDSVQRWSDNTFMSNPSDRVTVSAIPTAHEILKSHFLFFYITIEAEDAACFIGYTILYIDKMHRQNLYFLYIY